MAVDILLQAVSAGIIIVTMIVLLLERRRRAWVPATVVDVQNGQIYKAKLYRDGKIKIKHRGEAVVADWSHVAYARGKAVVFVAGDVTVPRAGGTSKDVIDRAAELSAWLALNRYMRAAQEALMRNVKLMMIMSVVIVIAVVAGVVLYANQLSDAFQAAIEQARQAPVLPWPWTATSTTPMPGGG